MRWSRRRSRIGLDAPVEGDLVEVARSPAVGYEAGDLVGPGPLHDQRRASVLDAAAPLIPRIDLDGTLPGVRAA